MYCVIMCCIVSPRLHGINEKYALLAVSGCFSHVLFCVSLPLVVLFLLLGFSLVSPEFASLLCILTLPSPLSCFQFTHFSSCALHICFQVHGFVSCVILTYFECIFVSFFTHLEKKPNLILRLSFLIFHL